MTAIRSLPEPSAPVKAHPTLRRKALAMVAVLKPNATPEALVALTRDQWQQLGERAGVGSPSPLVQGLVIDEVRAMREVLDG